MGKILDYRIGIVSPKTPNKLFEKDLLVWFNELEAAYAYLLQKSLNKIIIDSLLLEQKNPLTEKYLEQIRQNHPNLQIYYRDIPNNNDYNGSDIILYPSLETLFKHGDLKTHYQPILDVANGKSKIVGLECLSRLTYNSHNYPPEILFNYAEEKLRVKDYDQTCLWQALLSFPDKKDILIFINIRSSTFLEQSFLDWLKKILKTNHISPSQVVLEITEQYNSYDPKKLKQRADDCKKNGFKMAIDDFGSGMSNFNLLLILSPDYLKICGSIIKKAYMDKTKKIIIENILDLCQKLNIKPILEAIEDENDWQFLQSLNVSYVQGYYFFRPMESNDILSISNH